MSGETWNSLSDAQQASVTAAAQAATTFNNINRMADEASLVAFFQGEGLKVYEPNREAFRSRVQAMYLESKFAATWPEGIVDRVNAVE